MSVAKVSAPQKATTAFDNFESVDLRVARVTEAEMASGTRFPCRALKLDLGHLGQRLSIGQFAPHPQSPAGQSQATPLYVSSEANPGDQIF